MKRVGSKNWIFAQVIGVGIVVCISPTMIAGENESAKEKEGVSVTSAPPGVAGDHAGRAEVSREMSILIDVFLNMRLAGQLMGKGDWQKTLVVQQQVIERLDELLRSAPPPASQPPQPETQLSQQEEAPSPSPDQPVAQPDKAQSSPTETVGKQAKEGAETQTEELRQILRGLWGQLPERVRSQVSETIAEQFLPQYAPLIEQYYRRLAETLQPR
jgi:hypothetical protein